MGCAREHFTGENARYNVDKNTTRDACFKDEKLRLNRPDTLARLGGANITGTRLVAIYCLYQRRNEWTDWSGHTDQVDRPLGCGYPDDRAALIAAEKYRGPGTTLSMRDTVGVAVEHQGGVLIIYHHFSDEPFKHFAKIAPKINDLTKLKSIVANLPTNEIYGFDAYKSGEVPRFVDGRSAKDYYKRTAKAGGRLNSLAWSMKPYEPDISWAESLVGVINAAVGKAIPTTTNISIPREPRISSDSSQLLSRSTGHHPTPSKTDESSIEVDDRGTETGPAAEVVATVPVVAESTLPPPPDSPLEETEREQLTKSRTGQGLYRKRLEEIESFCRVTGLSDLTHLRASHIKPWRDCSDEEKLDGNNGFLLSPHIDHLFDQGYISFSDDGDLQLSSKLSLSVLAAWGLKQKINVGQFTSRQRFYLAYHREHIFKA